MKPYILIPNLQISKDSEKNRKEEIKKLKYHRCYKKQEKQQNNIKAF